MSVSWNITPSEACTFCWGDETDEKGINKAGNTGT